MNNVFLVVEPNSFPKTKHPPTHPGPWPSLLPAPVASRFEVTPVKYSDRQRESLECLDPAVLDHRVSGYMSSPLHSFAVQALRDSHRLMVSGNLGTMVPVSYASFAPDSTTASNSKLRARHRLGHRLCCKKLQGGKVLGRPSSPHAWPLVVFPSPWPLGLDNWLEACLTALALPLIYETLYPKGGYNLTLYWVP